MGKNGKDMQSKGSQKQKKAEDPSLPKKKEKKLKEKFLKKLIIALPVL